MTRFVNATAALALVFGCYFHAAPAHAQSFGKSLKGTVTFGGDKIPEPEKLNVNKDTEVCLANGPLFSKDWEVNAKNKGVKNVYVWLEPEKKGDPMPIHASLKENKQKEVMIDQPQCHFDPMLLAIREGTVIVVKNPAPINHNFRWTGHPAKNPGGNVNMIPKSSFPIKDLKADSFPVQIKCDIHPWMGGYIRVFDHPYFALTDENGKFEMPNPPAGKYRLIVWHPASGWVSADGKDGTKLGTVINIKAGAEADAPKLVVNKK